MNLGHVFRRLTALATAVTTLFYGQIICAAPSLAQMPPSLEKNLTPLSITVPPRIGEIKEKFEGKDGRMVLIVQDAHGIPDAQRSIRKLIEHFENRYEISSVALEGAASNLDPLLLKTFPDKKILLKILEDYFERGELAGGTAASILSESVSVYRGIEDWDLYQDGLGNFLAAMESETKTGEFLKDSISEIESKKESVYSKELLTIDRALRDFHENHSDLTGILEKLASVKPPEKGSELELVLSINRAREGNDEDLNVEIKKITAAVRRALEKSGDPKDLQKLHEKNQDFQTSRIDAKEFALHLKTICAKQKIRMKVSKRLNHLSDRQKSLKDIEGTRLFDDFEKYQSSVKETLFRSDEERELDRKSRHLDLLGRLSRLELSHEDWSEVKTLLSRMGYWNISLDLAGSGEANLLSELKSSLEFYRNSEKRDIALQNKTLEFMRNQKKKTSVLVAGGFHAEGLTNLFKAKGISYVLVMPKIDRLPENINYRAHMRGEVSWKDYFKIENGKVNVYNAFIRGTRDLLLKSSGEDRSRVLKSWRDEIIRNLASQNRLAESGAYTKFIDEVGGSNDGLIQWKKNIDGFLNRLRTLRSEGRLSEENIAQLFHSYIPDGPTAAPLAQGELRVNLIPELNKSTPSSELRSQESKIDPNTFKGAQVIKEIILDFIDRNFKFEELNGVDRQMRYFEISSWLQMTFKELIPIYEKFAEKGYRFEKDELAELKREIAGRESNLVDQIQGAAFMLGKMQGVGQGSPKEAQRNILIEAARRIFLNLHDDLPALSELRVTADDAVSLGSDQRVRGIIKQKLVEAAARFRAFDSEDAGLQQEVFGYAREIDEVLDKLQAGEALTGVQTQLQVVSDKFSDEKRKVPLTSRAKIKIFSMRRPVTDAMGMIRDYLNTLDRSSRELAVLNQSINLEGPLPILEKPDSVKLTYLFSKIESGVTLSREDSEIIIRQAVYETRRGLIRYLVDRRLQKYDPFKEEAAAIFGEDESFLAGVACGGYCDMSQSDAKQRVDSFTNGNIPVFSHHTERLFGGKNKHAFFVFGKYFVDTTTRQFFTPGNEVGERMRQAEKQLFSEDKIDESLIDRLLQYGYLELTDELVFILQRAFGAGPAGEKEIQRLKTVLETSSTNQGFYGGARGLLPITLTELQEFTPEIAAERFKRMDQTRQSELRSESNRVDEAIKRPMQENFKGDRLANIFTGGANRFEELAGRKKEEVFAETRVKQDKISELRAENPAITGEGIFSPDMRIRVMSDEESNDFQEAERQAKSLSATPALAEPIAEFYASTPRGRKIIGYIKSLLAQKYNRRDLADELDKELLKQDDKLLKEEEELLRQARRKESVENLLSRVYAFAENPTEEEAVALGQGFEDLKDVPLDPELSGKWEYRYALYERTRKLFYGKTEMLKEAGNLNPGNWEKLAGLMVDQKPYEPLIPILMAKLLEPENRSLLPKFFAIFLAADWHVQADVLYQEMKKSFPDEDSLRAYVNYESFNARAIVEKEFAFLKKDIEVPRSRAREGRKLIGEGGQDAWSKAVDFEDALKPFGELSFDQLLSLATVYFKDNYDVVLIFVIDDKSAGKKAILQNRLIEYSKYLSSFNAGFLALNPYFGGIRIYDSLDRASHGSRTMDSENRRIMHLGLNDSESVFFHELGHALDPYLILGRTGEDAPNIYRFSDSKKIDDFFTRYGYESPSAQVNGSQMQKIAALLPLMYERRLNAWKVLFRNEQYYDGTGKSSAGFWTGFLADLESSESEIGKAFEQLNARNLQPEKRALWTAAVAQLRQEILGNLSSGTYRDLDDETQRAARREKIAQLHITFKEILDGSFVQTNGDKRFGPKSEEYVYVVPLNDNHPLAIDPTVEGRLRQQPVEYKAERSRMYLTHYLQVVLHLFGSDKDVLKEFDPETSELLSIIYEGAFNPKGVENLREWLIQQPRRSELRKKTEGRNFEILPEDLRGAGIEETEAFRIFLSKKQELEELLLASNVTILEERKILHLSQDKNGHLIFKFLVRNADNDPINIEMKAVKDSSGTYSAEAPKVYKPSLNFVWAALEKRGVRNIFREAGKEIPKNGKVRVRDVTDDEAEKSNVKVLDLFVNDEIEPTLRVTIRTEDGNVEISSDTPELEKEKPDLTAAVAFQWQKKTHQAVVRKAQGGESKIQTKEKEEEGEDVRPKTKDESPLLVIENSELKYFPITRKEADLGIQKKYLIEKDGKLELAAGKDAFDYLVLLTESRRYGDLLAPSNPDYWRKIDMNVYKIMNPVAEMIRSVLRKIQSSEDLRDQRTSGKLKYLLDKLEKIKDSKLLDEILAGIHDAVLEFGAESLLRKTLKEAYVALSMARAIRSEIRLDPNLSNRLAVAIIDGLKPSVEPEQLSRSEIRWIYELAIDDFDALVRTIEKIASERVRNNQTRTDLGEAAIEQARRLLIWMKDHKWPDGEITLSLQLDDTQKQDSFLAQLLKAIGEQGRGARIFSNKEAQPQVSKRIAKEGLTDVVSSFPLRTAELKIGLNELYRNGQPDVPIALFEDAAGISQSMSSTFVGLALDNDEKNLDPDVLFHNELLFAAIFLLMPEVVKSKEYQETVAARILRLSTEERNDPEKIKRIKAEILKEMLAGKLAELGYSPDIFSSQSGQFLTLEGSVIAGLLMDMKARTELRKAA